MGLIIALYLTIILALFIILREFWCWYWKVNERLKEMESINDNLEEIKALLIHVSYIDSNNKKVTHKEDGELPKL